MSETFESIFIEIKAPSKRNIIVEEIYRPPNSSAIDCGEHVHGLLSNRYFDNKTCFIMGDFNLISWIISIIFPARISLTLITI